MVMPVVAVTDSSIKGHVYLHDMYTKNFSPEAFTQDNFYVQPCVMIPDDATNPGLLLNQLVRIRLLKWYSKILSDEGIRGQKTNHSLRATGVSKLYEAGVSEKFIQERSGHSTLCGPQQYKFSTVGQHEMVSQIISSKNVKNSSRILN